MDEAEPRFSKTRSQNQNQNQNCKQRTAAAATPPRLPTTSLLAPKPPTATPLDLPAYTTKAMRTPGAFLLMIFLLGAVLGLAKRIHATPCMGTDQTNYMYIFSNTNNTDYRAPLAGFSSQGPNFLFYDQTRDSTAIITGTCVTSDSGKLYVVGGSIVYPPLNSQTNGISVFDLHTGTWQQPIQLYPPVSTPVLDLMNSSRYLVTVGDWNSTTYLILFDKQSPDNTTAWWFINTGIIQNEPTSIIASIATTVGLTSSSFTSIAYLNQRIHIFGTGSPCSLDLQSYIVNKTSVLTISLDTPDPNPSTSGPTISSPEAKLPESADQAITFVGIYKIVLLSYSSSSIIVFDPATLGQTPIQYTVTTDTATGDATLVNLKDATLIPFNSTSLLLYTGVSDNLSPNNFALLDSNEHWHSLGVQGNNIGEASSTSLPVASSTPGSSSALQTSSLGPLIGGIVGGVVLVAIISFAVFFLWIRRGKNTKRKLHLTPLNVGTSASYGEGNYDPDDRTYTPHDRKSPTDDSLELGPPIMNHAVQQPLMMNSIGTPRSMTRYSDSSATITTGLTPVTYINNGTDAIIPSIAPPVPTPPTRSVSNAAISKRPSKSRGAVGLLGSLAVAKSVNQILDHFERGIEVYAQPDHAAVDPHAPADTVILDRLCLTDDPAGQPHPYVITRTASDQKTLDPVTIRFFATTPQSSYIFRKDAAVLHYLESQHTVSLLSSYELPQQHPYRHINVTEFCPMSLEHMILSEPEMVEDAFFLKLAVKSMLGALQWVQSKGIAHLDISLRSFYHEPGDTTTWKLSEFTSARVIDAEDVDWNSLNLSRFSAPELLLAQPGAGGPRVTAAMDMWSIGATIYEMYTKKQLFSSVEEAKIKCAQFSPDLVDMDHVEKGRVLILRRLLVADPGLRIDINEAVTMWERDEQA